MAGKRIVKRAQVTTTTLDHLWEEFIAEKKTLKKSDATIVSYQGSYDRFHDFLDQEGYSMNADDVTAKYMQDFTNHLTDNEDETLSEASINHYLREMRAFMYWGQVKGSITSFKVKLVTEPELIKETYTKSELKKLTDKPKQMDSFVVWRTWAIVNWVLATGNRTRSLCNVQMQDLWFESKEIHIRKTKNHREQIVPMNSRLSIILREYIKIWRANASGTDYLFCNVSDEALSGNAVKQSFRDFTALRDVPKTSIHALRHTFAKEWILNGGDVFRLQKMLGHRTLEMTKKYVNMFGQDLHKDFDDYNPLEQLNRENSRVHVVSRVAQGKPAQIRTA